MTKTDKIDAYWFAASNKLPHGDGREIALGKTHSLRGPIVLCKQALHWSRQPFDALQYAPGPFLYRVRAWGDVKEERDKGGSRHREYVAMLDATTLLRKFARNQALSVIHLWDAPEIVQKYLETGDETLRNAARDAARDAAYASYAAYAASCAAYAADAAAGAARDAAADAASYAAYAAGAAGAADAARTQFNEMVVKSFATQSDLAAKA